MKATLQMALEALEDPLAPTKRLKAITAIKEALAQQCVCGEPNSAGTHRTDGPCLAPQPEQEPVATMWQHGETGRTRITTPDSITDCDARWFKVSDLYTTPPQRTWVGLDNDDLVWIYSNSDKVGQAISNTEAKLKEKNA